MTYLKNAWYVACLTHQVRAGEMFHRTLLDEAVVFYRKQDGSPVALQDRCPHRFVPLHLGTIRGDQIECGYHGLRFDCSGACVKNPHGDGKIPAAAKVRAYPVEERHGMLWIWMGDAPADLALLPDYSVLDPSSGYLVSTGGYIHIKANYELMAENLLDLSHITYLHDGLLGSPEQVGADQVLTEDEGHIVCRRWMPGISVPGVFDMLYRRDQGLVDMWTEMRWMPPSCFLLDSGVHAVGATREDHGWYYGVHILTPETRYTTHYHFAAALPAGTRLTDAEAAKFAEMRRFAFEEQDKPILDAQQAALGETDFWAMKPVLLTIDAGPVRMRRAIERLIAAERQTAQPASVD
ncbi:aromatic ring-hydroxylating dioxygenase subunit alpha [Cupriavidus basilensis]|uniref:Aromatic ring-hydroxylating dioxygenase subunit alpha n=1 Tax=Cupriavidus basilensis TaxID=68895 RepID=A0ABT6ALA1_9BURK|nr:aromatic ring-hydroxylating dioxygenase subunit alpha [Cupriavidus basilensis]MDF3833203.1 aromatic ring-hydroxylating dioxygenase subunit alpha [Cupriavidus basilensis]